MMNSPYPLPHHTPPINHRQLPPPPTPSSPAVHPHSSSLPPQPSSSSIHTPPSTAFAGPGPNLAPPTPPPPPMLPAQRDPYYPPVRPSHCVPQDCIQLNVHSQLPWFSCSETSFPVKASRRRRRKPAPQSPNNPVQLPTRPEFDQSPEPDREQSQTSAPETSSSVAVEPSEVNANLETPATSLAPSEADSTQPTTPSSATAPAPLDRNPQPLRSHRIGQTHPQ